jgi:hypothetical protein
VIDIVCSLPHFPARGGRFLSVILFYREMPRKATHIFPLALVSVHMI